MVERVLATDAALDLIGRLSKRHGPLMFHQSGGCCDGSAPMCYPKGEFRVGGNDVHARRRSAAATSIWTPTSSTIGSTPS